MCDSGNEARIEEMGVPAFQVTELDLWDEVTLTTQPGSNQGLEFVCTPAQHRSGTCISACLRILVRRSAPAGMSDKDYPTPMGETVRPSTLQVKCLLSPRILSAADAFQLNFDDSDSGYMTTSGPCPTFKGLVPVGPLYHQRR